MARRKGLSTDDRTVRSTQVDLFCADTEKTRDSLQLQLLNNLII